MALTPKACLRPGCGKPVRARGLCTACWCRADKFVKEGKTTWDALEANGRALKAYGAYHGDADTWLLSATG